MDEVKTTYGHLDGEDGPQICQHIQEFLVCGFSVSLKYNYTETRRKMQGETGQMTRESQPPFTSLCISRVFPLHGVTDSRKKILSLSVVCMPLIHAPLHDPR